MRLTLYEVHGGHLRRVKGERREQGESRRADLEAKSSGERLTPSPGDQQSSNGIWRRADERSPRIDKGERERRGGEPKVSAQGRWRMMLEAGMGVGARSQ